MNYELEVGSVQIQWGEGRSVTVEGLKVRSNTDPEVWLKIFEAVSAALDEAFAANTEKLAELEKLFKN